MLTRDQAQVASSALLQPARAEQLGRSTKHAKQQRIFKKRRWIGGCALFGLAIGAAVGGAIPGHPFAANVVGIVVGGSIGALVAKVRA